jgi:hypothetical protein
LQTSKVWSLKSSILKPSLHLVILGFIILTCT